MKTYHETPLGKNTRLVTWFIFTALVTLPLSSCGIIALISMTLAEFGTLTRASGFRIDLRQGHRILRGSKVAMVVKG
jgi:hypothetical protein